MKRAHIFIAAMLALPLTLSGCGLRPMYASGTRSPAAQSLAHVEVDPIPGKAGWLVRNALVDRLGAFSNANDGPHYRLKVDLSDQITGSGLLLDSTVRREARILRARYNLVDVATGQSTPVRTTGSDAGIDVTSSEYGTIAAEDTALERLAQTIADQVIADLSQRAATKKP